MMLQKRKKEAEPEDQNGLNSIKITSYTFGSTVNHHATLSSDIDDPYSALFQLSVQKEPEMNNHFGLLLMKW